MISNCVINLAVDKPAVLIGDVIEARGLRKWFAGFGFLAAAGCICLWT